jgi:predicted kinase
MKKPLLVIVSGPPAAGKTALGRRVAQALRLPFINKDGIKESLFDTLGWRDRDWSKQLGRASSELLWHFVEAQLAAGASLVIESNFDARFATPRLRALRERFVFEPVQIQCIAAGAVLWQRFQARVASGERHPGHADQLNGEEFRSMLLNPKLDLLDIGGLTIEVDTTHFEQLDYDGLIAAIQMYG